MPTSKSKSRMRNGVPLFKPKKGAERLNPALRPNLELVNRLRDDEVPTQVSGEDRAARTPTRSSSSPPATKLLRK
jgi:hypothetical protein